MLSKARPYVLHAAIGLPVAIGTYALFLRRRSTTLRPKGGPLWKELTAWTLIQLGARGRRRVAANINMNAKVPCTLPDPTDYNDSFVFLGMDKHGNWMITRLGFRPDRTEVWLSLQGPDIGRFQVQPDEIPDVLGEDADITAGGVTYTPLDDGHFRITYGGEFRLELIYEPLSARYQSSLHMDATATARAMAEMPWSLGYFRKLKSEAQDRIEQGGVLRGVLVKPGGETFDIDMLAIRDHSYGKRDWTFMKRYLWWTMRFEEPLHLNGHEFNSFVYAIANYGTTFRHVVAGWIASKDTVLPIVEASDMNELAADGVIPTVFSVRFRPKGCSAVKMTVRRPQEHEISWFVHRGEFEVCESFCEFEIGEARGIGMAEFGFSKQVDSFAHRFE